MLMLRSKENKAPVPKVERERAAKEEKKRKEEKDYATVMKVAVCNSVTLSGCPGAKLAIDSGANRSLTWPFSSFRPFFFF